MENSDLTQSLIKYLDEVIHVEIVLFSIQRFAEETVKNSYGAYILDEYSSTSEDFHQFCNECLSCSDGDECLKLVMKNEDLVKCTVFEEIQILNRYFNINNDALKHGTASLKDVSDSQNFFKHSIECFKNLLSLIEINIFYQKTKAILCNLYSCGIIHPKYHNLTAISSIYEYLDTGITSSLKRVGNDPGAYYLYEENVRNNKIVDAISSGFTAISSQLLTIQKNQYTLYLAIQQSNQMLQNISKDLKDIQANQHALYSAMQDNKYLHNISIDRLSFFAKEIDRNARIVDYVDQGIWGKC